ncbi:MAG: hypothetical protein RLN62_00355 [Rickettsiales bacterium]
MISYILLSCLAFFLSYYLTKLCIKLFRKINLVDNPSGRKKHKHVTPTAGGLVILLAILLLSTVLIYFELTPVSIYFLCAVTILGLVSFVDDVLHLKIMYRLPIQFIASWLTIKSLEPIVIVKLSFIPDMALQVMLVVGMVYFINLYNFMDGIDGSACAEAVHIAFSFLTISLIYSIDNMYGNYIALILLFASLGFLIHNWSPAKIFLGDTGSTVLGLICGWLMLILAKSGYLAAAIIIPGYYIADSSLTLLKRILSKEKFWEPHTQHYFQIATQKLSSHSKVTRKIIKYNSILFVLAVISSLYPLICFLLAILVIARLLFKFNIYGKKIKD